MQKTNINIYTLFLETLATSSLSISFCEVKGILPASARPFEVKTKRFGTVYDQSTLPASDSTSSTAL